MKTFSYEEALIMFIFILIFYSYYHLYDSNGSFIYRHYDIDHYDSE